MRIADTDPSLRPPVSLSLAHPTNKRGRSPHAIPNDDGQPKKTASAPLEPRESSESESRGVMRLLEANHFRGVADVRLRINFFDELSAASASKAQETAEAQAQLFLDGVDGAVNDFLASLSLDDEMMEAIGDRIASFEDDVRAALGSNVTESSVDADALADALRSVFENLTTEMSLLVSPPANDVVPEPVVDTVEPAPVKVVGKPGDSSDPVRDVVTEKSPPSTDGVDTIDLADAGFLPAVKSPDAPSVVDTTLIKQDGAEPAADSSLTVLIGAFEGFLADYLSSIQSASQLADPAPYDGNGSAYAKFLGVYDELRGVSPTVDEQV